jgi:hypothetical protein
MMKVIMLKFGSRNWRLRSIKPTEMKWNEEKISKKSKDKKAAREGSLNPHWALIYFHKKNLLFFALTPDTQSDKIEEINSNSIKRVEIIIKIIMRVELGRMWSWSSLLDTFFLKIYIYFLFLFRGVFGD